MEDCRMTTAGKKKLTLLTIPRGERTPQNCRMWNIEKGPTILRISNSMNTTSIVDFLLCPISRVGSSVILLRSIVVEWKINEEDWLYLPELGSQEWKDPRHWDGIPVTTARHNLTVIPILQQPTSDFPEKFLDKVFDMEWNTEGHKGTAWCVLC